MAKGKKIDEILEELGEVAEGILTSKAILKLANLHNIYTPIAREVSLTIDGKDPKKSLIAVSYTHLTLPTTARRCRSRWSPYH